MFARVDGEGAGLRAALEGDLGHRRTVGQVVDAHAAMPGHVEAVAGAPARVPTASQRRSMAASRGAKPSCDGGVTRSSPKATMPRPWRTWPGAGACTRRWRAAGRSASPGGTRSPCGRGRPRRSTCRRALRRASRGGSGRPPAAAARRRRRGDRCGPGRSPVSSPLRFRRRSRVPSWRRTKIEQPAQEAGLDGPEASLPPRSWGSAAPAGSQRASQRGARRPRRSQRRRAPGSRRPLVAPRTPLAACAAGPPPATDRRSRH